MMDTEKPKVLLVDDDDNVLMVLQATFAHNNFEILTASGGMQAVVVCRQQCPRVVLLDVDMPKQDGFETCKILKRDPVTGGIPVILLTAMAQEVDVAKGIEVGADDYVTKPFSPTALIERVERFLESYFTKGQRVRLTGGRSGVVLDRISLEAVGLGKVGYTVNLDGGGTATAPASEVTEDRVEDRLDHEPAA